MNQQAQIVSLRGFLDNMGHLAKEIQEVVDDLGEKKVDIADAGVNISLLKNNIDEAQDVLNQLENPDIGDVSAAEAALKGFTGKTEEAAHNPGAQPPEEVSVDLPVIASRNPDLNRGTVEITIVKITGAVPAEEAPLEEAPKPRSDGLTQADIDRFAGSLFSLGEAGACGLN